MKTDTLCVSSDNATEKKQVVLIEADTTVFPAVKTNKELVFEDLPPAIQNKIVDVIADLKTI